LVPSRRIFKDDGVYYITRTLPTIPRIKASKL